jgi:hypothetical protein
MYGFWRKISLLGGRDHPDTQLGQRVFRCSNPKKLLVRTAWVCGLFEAGWLMRVVRGWSSARLSYVYLYLVSVYLSIYLLSIYLQ